MGGGRSSLIRDTLQVRVFPCCLFSVLQFFSGGFGTLKEENKGRGNQDQLPFGFSSCFHALYYRRWRNPGELSVTPTVCFPFFLLTLSGSVCLMSCQPMAAALFSFIYLTCRNMNAVSAECVPGLPKIAF